MKNVMKNKNSSKEPFIQQNFQFRHHAKLFTDSFNVVYQNKNKNCELEHVNHLSAVISAFEKSFHGFPTECQNCARCLV